MAEKLSENINALDEIHKGACMGVDAIAYVIDKVEDKELKKELEKESTNYGDIAKEIEDIYSKYDDGNPHDTTAVNKTMTWTKIEIKTMNDNSSSKIAELLLNGVNMGIIEGTRILNKKKINKEVENVVKKYVNMQEESVEALKRFL